MRILKTFVLFALIAGFLPGCAFSEKRDADSDFKKLEKLSDLNGVYSNFSGHYDYPHLSVLVFGPEAYINRIREHMDDDVEALHDSVEKVSIKAVDSETLKVVALTKNDAPVFTGSFKLDKDFKNDDGAYTLTINEVASTQMGMVAWAATHNIRFGLSNGNALLVRSKTAMVGALLLLPSAGTQTTSYRYERIR